MGKVRECMDMGRERDSSKVAPGGKRVDELAATCQISVGSRIPTSTMSMFRLPNYPSASAFGKAWLDSPWLPSHPFQRP